MDNVLSFRNVRKTFGKRRVLEDVSLGVRPGERLAVLGHNGAGKSTLIRLALGLLPLDQGTISVGGAAAGSTAARMTTAYLPEAPAFHPALSGREQMRLFANLSGVDRSEADILLERVGLQNTADRRIGTWSKGMRQRLGLAQVLLGRPAVALLDEPTSGLDPLFRSDLYSMVDEMTARGTAVLVASHALSELETRTDRIAILCQGRVVVSDRLEPLREKAGLPVRLKVKTTENHAVDLHARFGGTLVNGSSVEVLCPPSEKMARLAEITGMGELVHDLEVTQPSLEDIYEHYSQGASP